MKARVVTLVVTTFLVWWLNRYPSYPALAGHIFLFSKQSCVFCQRLEPEWQKFVRALPGDAGVAPVKVQETDDESLALQLGVRKFPTIVMIDPSGARRDFTGPRTAQALLAFALGK